MAENVVKGKDFRKSSKRGSFQNPKPAVPARMTHRVLLTTVAIIVGLALAGATSAPLSAQSYPTKPIRLILPYAPGGAVDTVGRIVGLMLSERLGQPVVCENRPGAGSTIGTEFVVKARPDGYTLLLASASITINPSIYKKLSYDATKDLTPISLVAQGHQVLLVHPSLPVKTLKDLVEYARTNPQKLNFGSSGVGGPGHLAYLLLKSLTKVDVVHVPYKGASPAMVGLIGGEIQMMVSSGVASVPHIQAGKVRALAVLSHERARSLPNIPTAKEAGIENFVVMSRYGILAPSGAPRDVISRLNLEWGKIAPTPDAMEKMEKAGVEPLSSTPEQYSEFLKAEIERWIRVTKEAGISLAD